MRMPNAARDRGTAMMELRLKPRLLEQTTATMAIDDTMVAGTDFLRRPATRGSKLIPAAPKACIST
ncbi:hypothetical protein D3C76_1562130 [compost metagenome]